MASDTGSGSRTDLRTLVQEQSDPLLRAARLLTGDWATAETLLRDTLAATVSRWGRDRAGTTAAIGLRIRLVRRYLGGTGKYRASGTPSGALLQALANLDPNERAIAVARYYLGLSAAETAAAAGGTAADVAATAVRVLAALRRADRPAADADRDQWQDR
jgi:DNA-directed RNA polymerase specialized sigma24 family protein